MRKNCDHPASAYRRGQVMVLEQVADPHIFMIDDIVPPHQLERQFVMDVVPAALVPLEETICTTRKTMSSPATMPPPQRLRRFKRSICA
jgi:hypothetical protein